MATAILLLLLERAGELVTKEEIAAQVWAGALMEEATLRVHVAALRRCLGEQSSGTRFIATIAGRGYQFVHPVDVLEPDPAYQLARLTTPNWLALPRSIPRVIGREEVIDGIIRMLNDHGLVTLVGPGGIGKTTVSVAAAACFLDESRFRVGFVDLAIVTRPQEVGMAIASTLGLTILATDPRPAIVECLRARPYLLLLDSCERVPETVAEIVELLVSRAPETRILATSREPLRTEFERVFRLPPLELPPPSAAPTAVAILQYPAVQLFVDRATAAAENFVLTDENADLVVRICTRLDGIALAIELAAAQVAAFGLQRVSELLDQRFRLTMRGRRTAPSRHQTMQAVLDWSYETLSESQRLVLCRLALFRGLFSLEAAQFVAHDRELTPAEVVVHIADLTDRSLLLADFDQEPLRHRLLDTTRAYALQRLSETGAQDEIAKRHAEYQLHMLAAAETSWAQRTNAEWLDFYGREIGDIRAALDWSFSRPGHERLALDLSNAALPLMFELSLGEECRRRAEQALALLSAVSENSRYDEMRLRSVLAAAQMYAPGPSPETIVSWETVVRLAQELGFPPAESRALWGLWTGYSYAGEPLKALDYAYRLKALASRMGNDARQLMADRIIGTSLHAVGRHKEAVAHLSTMITRYDPEVHRFRTLGFPTDHGVLAQTTLARVNWVLGRPHSAGTMLSAALDAARAQGYAISLGYVLLEGAIPLAILSYDLLGAAELVEELHTLAARGGIAIWQAGGAMARLVVEAMRGDPIDRVELDLVLQRLRTTGYRAQQAWLSGVLAECLGEQGRPNEGLLLVREALALCITSGKGWCLPELQRIQGVLHLRGGGANAHDLGQRALTTAIDLAREQHALAFELRATNSLARHLLSEGHLAETKDLMRPLIVRLGELADTQDGFAAAGLLADLID
jgi:predicted ATPase